MSEIPYFIGLCGPKRSGKDTVAQIILRKCDDFRRVAFADIMKSMALAIDPMIATPPYGCERLSTIVEGIGWEQAKGNDDVRRLLQRLGTEGGRNHLGQDVWVDATWEQSVMPFAQYNRFVFTDVRFTNEIDSIRDNGGEIWRIHRPEVEDGDFHPSEREWRSVEPDWEIDNSGRLGELYVQVVNRLEGRDRGRNAVLSP